LSCRVVDEGEPFEIDREDRETLQRLLGANLETLHDGRFRVSGLVGHVALPSGSQLRIQSRKASARSLFAWMAFADPSLGALKELGRVPDSVATGDLSSVASRLFCTELLRVASRHGLRRSYHRVRNEGATIRGRIDFNRLSRLGGNASRVPCVAWERLPSTPLNRFLAFAAVVIRRDTALAAAAGSHLAEVEALLVGIPPEVDGGLLAARRPLTRVEQPYELACALARLIVKSSGVAEGTQEAGPAFLIDIAWLFERGVAQALLESPYVARPKERLPYAISEPSTHLADHRGAMEMDVFLPRFSGRSVIIDAKYKSTVASSNLHQLVTYCYMTGARHGVLVFPDAGTAPVGRRYTFSSPAAPLSDLRIDVLVLSTTAESIDGWRAAGRTLVGDLERLFPPEVQRGLAS